MIKLYKSNFDMKQILLQFCYTEMQNWPENSLNPSYLILHKYLQPLDLFIKPP